MPPKQSVNTRVGWLGHPDRLACGEARLPCNLGAIALSGRDTATADPQAAVLCGTRASHSSTQPCGRAKVQAVLASRTQNSTRIRPSGRLVVDCCTNQSHRANCAPRAAEWTHTGRVSPSPRPGRSLLQPLPAARSAMRGNCISNGMNICSRSGWASMHPQ